MKYYAVKSGRRPGIYTNWPDCEKQVHGYSGAVYKSFSTEIAAQNWMGTAQTPEARQEPSVTASSELLPPFTVIVDGDNVTVPPPPPHHGISNVPSDTYVVVTDGACSPNPGVGGYAALIYHASQEPTWRAAGVKLTTNNRMEMLALIEGLSHLPNRAHAVVLADSEYVLKTLGGEFARRKNHDLWKLLDEQINRLSSVRYVWTRGHAGNPVNEYCDQLAVAARENRLKLGFQTDYGYMAS